MSERPQENTHELLTQSNLHNPFKKPHIPWFWFSTAKHIGMGNYGITDSRSNNSKWLITSGIGMCVAVGLYRKDTHTLAIAHFTLQNTPESLQDIIDEMAPSKTSMERSKISAVFKGGLEDISDALIHGLLRTAYENELQIIGSALRYQGDELLSGFSMSARSGRIRSGVYPLNPTISELPRQHNTPIRKAFDGRKK